MKIMAVDLGKARTGVAISDESEGFAFPCVVINEYNEDKLVAKLDIKAKELSAKLIVVGLPKNMDGSEGERAKECSAIAQKLQTLSQIETVLWDERCTTISAHTALNYTNTKGKKRKEKIDAVAAVMILEDYLKYRKNSGLN